MYNFCAKIQILVALKLVLKIALTIIANIYDFKLVLKGISIINLIFILCFYIKFLILNHC